MFAEILTIVATIAAFILAIYFYFMARRNLMADMYLGVLLFLFSITFLFNYFDFAGVLESNPGLIFLDMGIPYILGPVIWFYVSSLTHINRGLTFDRLLHLVPAIIIYIVFLDIVFLPPEKKIELLNMPASEAGTRYQVHTILQLIPVPIYLIVSIVTIKKYQARIRKTRSATEKLSHKGLGLFLVLFLLFWIAISAGLILANFFPTERLGFLVFTIGMLVFSIIIGMYGMLRNNAYRILESNDFEIDKAVRTSWEEERKEKIEEYINTYKPFLEPELTLHQLADMTGMQAHLLSSLLNTVYGEPFFDFINERRVEEFKERIRRGDHHKFSILAIAYDSGFNSKTAFYRFFKKKEGTSPGEYIRKRSQE
jgi:AraC-like DNA-binding protein